MIILRFIVLKRKVKHRQCRGKWGKKKSVKKVFFGSGFSEKKFKKPKMLRKNVDFSSKTLGIIC
ncbi:hypothetical protein F4826_001678 [Rahnella inusitata]|nr:hypothetical protein [Rahnella inusitata]